MGTGQEVYTGGFYSMAQTLKPFSGFEAKYQGLAVADNPIAVPGGYDPQAGKPGYDPNLIKMLPVPMGSRVKLWLPRFTPVEYIQQPPAYEYKIVWRVRSLRDAVTDVTDQLNPHFSRLLPGRDQIPALVPANDSAGPRFVIPCSIESISTPASPLTEPETVNVNSVLVRANRVNSSAFWPAPLMSSYVSPNKVGHAGLYSQGFFPDGNNTAAGVPGSAAGPNYFTYSTEAAGDEMGILISRPGTDSVGGAAPNWDFSGIDLTLSQILGTGNGALPNNPNIGIYVFTGSSA